MIRAVIVYRPSASVSGAYTWGSIEILHREIFLKNQDPLMAAWDVLTILGMLDVDSELCFLNLPRMLH